MRSLPLCAAASLALCSPANAALVLIDLDDVPTTDFVDEFYNGGTSSSGATGTNFGISFSNFRALTGFGETTGPNFVTATATTAVINSNIAFTEFSFTGGSFQPGTISVFSGVGGAGALLGSFTGELGDPFGFGAQSVIFSGEARSVVIAGAANTLGFDDFQFLTVPEPTSWALLFIGFVAVGGAMRSKRKQKALPVLG